MGLDSGFWSADQGERQRGMEQKKSIERKMIERGPRESCTGGLSSFHRQGLCFPCPHPVIKATTSQSQGLHVLMIQNLLFQVSGLNSCQAVQSCLVVQPPMAPASSLVSSPFSGLWQSLRLGPTATVHCGSRSEPAWHPGAARSRDMSLCK